MTAKELVAFILELEQHHERKYNPSSIELIWPNIIDLHAEALPTAADRLKTEHNTLPAPSAIKNVLTYESKKFDGKKEAERVAAWEKKKQAERQKEVELFKVGVGEGYERDARSHMRVLFFGKSTPREKYESALHMVETYPSIHEPEEAEKFYNAMVAAEAEAAERAESYAAMKKEIAG